MVAMPKAADAHFRMVTRVSNIPTPRCFGLLAPCCGGVIIRRCRSHDTPPAYHGHLVQVSFCFSSGDQPNEGAAAPVCGISSRARVSCLTPFRLKCEGPRSVLFLREYPA